MVGFVTFEGIVVNIGGRKLIVASMMHDGALVVGSGVATAMKRLRGRTR